MHYLTAFLCPISCAFVEDSNFVTTTRFVLGIARLRHTRNTAWFRKCLFVIFYLRRTNARTRHNARVKEINVNGLRRGGKGKEKRKAWRLLSVRRSTAIYRLLCAHVHCNVAVFLEGKKRKHFYRPCSLELCLLS